MYPWIAAQALQALGRPPLSVLELGSFAGGISFVLSRDYPDVPITIAADDPSYLEYLGEEARRQGLPGRIRLVHAPLDSTPFAGRSFDLVVLRGAFFFIMDNPAILAEIHRLLSPGGLGFAGGGYGRDAPPAIVDGIAEESRRLNDALGRRRVSVRDLSRLLAATGLDGCTRIVEEGGVWLEMRCPESP